MTETTPDDKIVKVSSVEMSAYGKTSRNVEFNVCNPDDSVTIKVFDTLYKKKVLSNTITIPEE